MPENVCARPARSGARRSAGIKSCSISSPNETLSDGQVIALCAVLPLSAIEELTFHDLTLVRHSAAGRADLAHFGPYAHIHSAPPRTRPGRSSTGRCAAAGRTRRCDNAGRGQACGCCRMLQATAVGSTTRAPPAAPHRGSWACGDCLRACAALLCACAEHQQLGGHRGCGVQVQDDAEALPQGLQVQGGCVVGSLWGGLKHGNRGCSSTEALTVSRHLRWDAARPQARASPPLPAPSAAARSRCWTSSTASWCACLRVVVGRPPSIT